MILIYLVYGLVEGYALVLKQLSESYNVQQSHRLVQGQFSDRQHQPYLGRVVKNAELGPIQIYQIRICILT